MGIFNFVTDFIYSIVDIYETWKEKETKILSKVFFTIFTLVLLVVSAKIWL